jgi:hypothetical protein
MPIEDFMIGIFVGVDDTQNSSSDMSWDIDGRQRGFG